MKSRFYGMLGAAPGQAGYSAKGQVRKQQVAPQTALNSGIEEGQVFQPARPAVPQSRLVSDAAQQIMRQQAEADRARQAEVISQQQAAAQQQRLASRPRKYGSLFEYYADKLIRPHNQHLAAMRSGNRVNLPNYGTVGNAVAPGTAYVVTPGGLAAVPGVGDPDIARRASQYSMGTMPQRMRWAMTGGGPTLANFNYGGGR